MAGCLCGVGKSYKTCCEPYHKGDALPETAEQLMRARYTAFAKGELAFLKSSIAPESLHDYDEAAIKTWSENSKWLGLTVVKSAKGQPNDSIGTVEFIAKFHFEKEDREHHEVAEFKKISGQWYYTDGKVKGKTVRNENKVGRNDPCPCGSGKKYKKCCAN